MAEVFVEFQDNRRRFTPGEELRGEVVITAHKPLKCKDVLAKLQCFAHGYGNSTSKDISQLSLFKGELPAGEHRLAFSFMLPAGPYTYHGHYTNLEWRVEGYVDIPWAIDKKNHEPFTLSAAPIPAHITEEIPAQPDAHKTSYWFVWFILGGISAFIAAVIGFLAFTEDDGLFCVMSFFVVGAAGFLFFGVKSLMATRVITSPKISIDPWPLRPGQESTYTLEFTPGAELTLNSIVVELKCQEVVVRGHGTDATTHRHLVHSDIFTLAVGAQYRRGQPAKITQDIELPAHLPASFELPSNNVKWTIETRVDIPLWPDWKDTHALHVAAASVLEDSGPENTSDAPGPAW